MRAFIRGIHNDLLGRHMLLGKGTGDDYGQATNPSQKRDWQRLL